MNIKNIIRKTAGTCLIAGGLFIGSAGIFIGYDAVTKPFTYCSKDTLRLLRDATYASSSESKEEFPQMTMHYLDLAKRLMVYHNKEIPQQISSLESNIHTLGENYQMNEHSPPLQKMIREEAREKIRRVRADLEMDSPSQKLGVCLSGLVFAVLGIGKGLNLILRELHLRKLPALARE